MQSCTHGQQEHGEHGATHRNVSMLAYVRTWAHEHALLHGRVQASISTRKGNKKLVIFDLVITLAWEGKAAADSDKVVSGGALPE